MGLMVLACRWVLEYSPQTPDAVLLAVEVLVGVLTYAVFARRQIAWFVRQG
jgi:hypothetical protein